MRDRTAKFLSSLHAAAYRLTGGRVGSRLVDNDMLLLTTTGRVTGRAHTIPLLYLESDSGFVVFASWGGRDHHPEWYRNLVVDPAAEVRIGDTTREVRARTLEGSERSEWWQRAMDAYAGYADYQRRTDRSIPVVLLEPA